MKESRVDDIARAFDASFETLPEIHPPARESLLVMKVAGEDFALRCAGLLSLARARTITSLPGSRPAILGLTGHQGHLVPVFCLAVHLGLSPTAAPKWLALAKLGTEGMTVALAFEELVRQVVVDAENLPPSNFARGAICQLSEGQSLALLSLPRLLQEILEEGTS